MEKASDSSVHSDDNDTGPWKDKGDGGKVHKGDLSSTVPGFLEKFAASSIGEDGHKDGYIGWAKKFMLIMPMIFMGLNAQVQSREIVDSLGTRVFTGFEDESFVASGGKVILDKKSDLPDSSWNNYDYYLTGQWDRVGIYLYDKTGKMDSTTWTNYVCNDSSSSKVSWTHTIAMLMSRRFRKLNVPTEDRRHLKSLVPATTIRLTLRFLSVGLSTLACTWV